MMKSISYNFNFILILCALLLACNESVIETSPLDENLVFTPDTRQAALLSDIALLDGSSDNIIDNASCLRIQLPYSLTVNDETRVITSDQDVERIRNEYLADPFSRFEISINFPVTAIRADYSEVIINSDAQLAQLRNTCIENGDDEDIECVDFVYPVSIATYDRLNQLADVQTVNSDMALFNLLRNFSGSDLLSLEFPLTVVLKDGTEQIVTDNAGLLSLIDSEGFQCEEDDRLFNPGTATPKQFLRLFLTDAPFPADLVDEVNVNLTKIDIKTGPENNEIEFIALFDENITVNLLDLTNGNTLDLSTTELPLGSYPSMRMFVNDGSVLLKDGREFELKVPSGSQSGIKILFREDLVLGEDDARDVLLDFDISRSLIVRGNPNTPAGINGFNFRPVIKASILSESGSLSGRVTDLSSGLILPDTQITLMAADTVYTTSFTDESGNYRIIGITPGEFEVFAELNGYEPASAVTVEIEAGDESVIDFELEED